MTDMTPPQEAVAAYLRHLKVRNIRPHTIYNRRRALARLALWAGGRPLLELTAAELTEWQEQRSDEISAAARGAELSNVREMYRWAYKGGLIDRDPTAGLDMPRAHRGTPRPISEDDLARALQQADDRMAAILGLASFAGLRAAEIARLNWAEVGHRDFTPMVRVLDGKGGHGRLITLAPVLVDILLRLPDRTGPVITRIDGQPGHNSPSSISGLANRYLHRVGIRESLHCGRHRFGTQTYRACQDILAVRDVMGHATVTSTQIYASASPTVARDAVLAAGVLRTA